MPNESAAPIHGERLVGLVYCACACCGLLLRPLWMRSTAPFRLQLLERAMPACWDLPCGADRPHGDVALALIDENEQCALTRSLSFGARPACRTHSHWPG